MVHFAKEINVVSIYKRKEIFKVLPNILALKKYSNGHRGFDNPKFDPFLTYRFGTFDYNEPATQSAWSEAQ